MATSYNKLWKLLIDKGMRKKDLKIVAGISSGVITKMGKGEAVTTTVLAKICKALDCNIGDIMEFVDDEAYRTASTMSTSCPGCSSAQSAAACTAT